MRPTLSASVAGPVRALVVAKAPETGRVKTRLGAMIGMQQAAEVAAAALLDTLQACVAAVGEQHCVIALDGDLGAAVRGEEIEQRLSGWTVRGQRGESFGDRLANAHLDVPPGGPVLQVGMDTPQLTDTDLHHAAAVLEEFDAVLGPAEDGGWWLLGLRDPQAAQALRAVPMSTSTTYTDTRLALEADGVRVGLTTTLRDVDTVGDAETVSRAILEGGSAGRFATTWAGVRR